MSITTIGQRFVRSFGKGENSVKVVSECVNGKTYTRVLDKDGKVLQNCLKMTERTNVGNKKVSTITKVKEFPQDHFVRKTTYNRVYNSEGDLQGIRYIAEVAVDDDNLQKSFVIKQGATGLRQMKSYWAGGDMEGKMCEKVARELPLGRLPKYFHSGDSSLSYNNKGLPCPRGLEPYNNMSLKEMKDWHFANHPERHYAHPDLNLGFLDERGADNAMLNNLDKYI